MANKAKTTYETVLTIDGGFAKTFKSIQLNQEYGRHHTFEVVLGHEAIEARGAYTLEKAKQWLGKKLTISFAKTDFVGIVTYVGLAHVGSNFEGDVTVKGSSKTILLEGGAHTQSWTEKTLAAIVKDVCGQAGVAANIAPQFTEAVPYEVQHKESHFCFLQRLANKYGEWLYYDGTHLCFGKPKQSGEAVKVRYGREASSFNTGMNARSTAQARYYYYEGDDKWEGMDGKGRVAGLNELADDTLQVSKELFKIKPQAASPSHVKDRFLLEKDMEKEQARLAARMNVVKLETKQQGITVGTPLVLSAHFSEGTDKGPENKHYGDYLVYSIAHTAEDVGSYENEITALPGNLKTFPEINGIKWPVAHSQVATVTDNADPKGTGRVKVKFQWMQNEMESNWARAMAPDAGAGNQHAVNRGHVFVPEVGDQVMMGFEMNDPCRPYVMGSLFHGQNGAGGGQGNNVKGIVTRSGHVIRLDDTRNKESITITDKNQNTIFFDTANESVVISSPGHIEITGKNLDFRGESNVNIISKEVTIKGTESINILGGEEVNIQAKKFSANADEIGIDASDTLNIEGKMMTTLKGGQLFLEGTGPQGGAPAIGAGVALGNVAVGGGGGSGADQVAELQGGSGASDGVGSGAGKESTTTGAKTEAKQEEDIYKVLFTGSKQWGSLQTGLATQNKRLTEKELDGGLDWVGKANAAILKLMSKERVRSFYEKGPLGARTILSDDDDMENQVISNFYTGAKSKLSFDEHSIQSQKLKVLSSFQEYFDKYLNVMVKLTKDEEINQAKEKKIVDGFVKMYDEESAYPNFSNITELPSHDYYGLMGNTQRIKVDMEIAHWTREKGKDVDYYKIKTKMYIGDWYGADWADINGWKSPMKGNVYSLNAFFWLQHYYGCHPFETEIIYESEDRIEN